MKKRNIFIVATSFLSAMALSFGLGLEVKGESKASPVHAEEVSATDYSRFRLRKGSDGSIVAGADKITYTGAWDSNFCVTDQFNTYSTDYSLKAHLYSATSTRLGFVIYQDADNYITFYLEWGSNNAPDAASFSCHVNGAWENVYDSSKQGGAYTTRGTWETIWTDGGGWSETQDGANVNLRTDAKILLSIGFDVTLHVVRKVHLGRLADVITMKIDAFAADGVTPKTFYSPSYALDALTNPKGAGEVKFASMNPQIGFYSDKAGNEISEIEFTDHAAKDHAAKLETIGDAEMEIDLLNNAVDYRSTAEYSGFAAAYGLPTSSTEKFVVSADVSSLTVGDTGGMEIGFTYFLDFSNYMYIYFYWNGALGGPEAFRMGGFAKGQVAGEAQYARDPWDSYKDQVLPMNVWSDFEGFVTDSTYPCGTDSNWNLARDEYDSVIPTSGINVALYRARRTYSNRLVDTFTLRLTGNGKDGKVHNWYSPIIAYDGYTYPKGGAEASSVINTAPLVGLYAAGVGSSLTFSNMRFNGGEVALSLTDRQIVREFCADDLLMGTIPTSETSDTGYCKTVIDDVIDDWDALTEEQQELLLNDAEFAEAEARFEAWLKASGKKLDVDNSVINANFIGLKTFSANYLPIIITVIVATSALALGTFLLTKKRKNK